MRLGIALVIAALAPVLPAQQVLRMFSVFEAATMDPIQSNDPNQFRYFSNVFEAPLEIALDERGRCVIAPSLCSFPEISKDGRMLTFTVQRGARFADDPCFPDGKGREVVAGDVVYSLLRIADPKWGSAFFASYLGGRVAGLDAWHAHAAKEKVADYDVPPAGLRADGDKLIVQLVTPYPQLLPLLTQPWASIVPREAVSAYGSGFGEHPVGTGPFVFGGRDALGTVRLTRNRGYRNPERPFLDEVRFEIIPDIDRRTERFLAGELHMCDVWPQNEDRLMDRTGKLRQSLLDKGSRFVAGPPLDVSYLVLNFRNTLLAKLPLRQAMTLALDRKKVNRILFGERSIIADSPIPPAFAEATRIGDKPFAFSVPDPARAKKLLAESGWPDGKGLPEFILDVAGAGISPRDKEAAESMIKDLAAVGIRVQLRTPTMEQFSDRCRSGDFQIAWVSWYADYADVENFLILFRSHPEDPLKNSNYGYYANAQFDKLYDRIQATYPSLERTELVVEAVEILRQDLPWVFLGFSKRGYLVHKSVQGFRSNFLNQSLRDVTIEPARK